MLGLKHVVECTCILPQYKNQTPPVFHQFVVFSIINNQDELQPDYAQCNNCGVIHKVVDACKSEILSGQENLSSIISIEDIKMMIPSDLSMVLENYSCDLPNWQHAYFIYSNQKWGEKIILVRENFDDEIRGKILSIDGSNKFRIEPFAESIVIK